MMVDTSRDWMAVGSAEHISEEGLIRLTAANHRKGSVAGEIGSRLILNDLWIAQWR
jgi:hypothetical protein